MRNDLPSKLAPGTGANKNAGSQRVGTVAYAVEKLGEDADAGPSTEGGCVQDTESNDMDNEGEEQVFVALPVLPAKPRKKKGSAQPDQNEILLTLCHSVRKLQSQMKEMKAEWDVGLIATLSWQASLEEKGETRSRRHHKERGRKTAIRDSEESQDEQSVSESVSGEDTRRRKRRGECKEVKRRKVAERANVVMPLSGLKLELNIHDEDTLTATTLLNWYTKYGTCYWVEQCGTFEGSEMLRN